MTPPCFETSDLSQAPLRVDAFLLRDYFYSLRRLAFLFRFFCIRELAVSEALTIYAYVLGI